MHVRTGRWGRAVATVATVVAATVAVGAVPAAAVHGAAPKSYVALGDSYTAAPLVLPLAPASPLDCLQSAINYPHLTAAAFGFSLTDRSCSSATTANMTTAQYLDQPPQFHALKTSTSVVTIGIGGNDNQLFLSAIAACSAIDVLDIGAPCQAVFGNYFVNLVNGDAPVIGRALATIHTRSPSAQVFVVGYPDILPRAGSCYPLLPITTGDVAYLNGLERALNNMLRTQAAAHGATFVDTYTPSLGHDACQAAANRWVEPVLPGTDAFPIHPNARGEAADFRALQVALHGAGI